MKNSAACQQKIVPGDNPDRGAYEMLQDTIAAALHEALRSRNELRLSVFRMLSAAVHNREIEIRANRDETGLRDDDVIAVVRSEQKKRRDAREAYQQAGRHDAASREEAEALVLGELLPPELSDAELDELAREGANALGAASLQDLGKVMGWLRGKAVNRASGERMAQAVRRALGDAG